MKLTEWTTTSFYSAPEFKDKYWRVTSYKDFTSPMLAHDFIEYINQNEKLRKLVESELKDLQEQKELDGYDIMQRDFLIELLEVSKE